MFGQSGRHMFIYQLQIHAVYMIMKYKVNVLLLSMYHTSQTHTCLGCFFEYEHLKST